MRRRNRRAWRHDDLWRPFNRFRLGVRIKVRPKCGTHKVPLRPAHMTGIRYSGPAQSGRPGSPNRREDHPAGPLRPRRRPGHSRCQYHESCHSKSLSHDFARYSPNPRRGQASAPIAQTWRRVEITLTYQKSNGVMALQPTPSGQCLRCITLLIRLREETIHHRVGYFAIP